VPNVLSDRDIGAFLESEPRIPSWGKAEQPLTRHTAESHWHWLATHAGTAGIVAQLFGGQPRVVQTAYLRKEPLAPGAVANTGIGFHRDSLFVRTKPETLLACWVALNDTDSDNGGLCVVPGSHLETPRLTANPVLKCKGFQITHRLRDRKGREWTSQFNAAKFNGIDPSDVVQLKVKRGGAVFFGGRLIHGSYSNFSPDRERLAAAVHYVKDGTWVFRIDLQNTMAVTVA
jgi:ectoine hydroxylase-related dioxygenase (phytanoyl-CoA dioxygenase family)